MSTLIVVPTYNEKDNIPHLIGEIFRLNPDVHILVVDDSSPDGTAQTVTELKSKGYPKSLHLLLRKQKQGLGKAYLAGFEWGLTQGYSYIFEMDADFSHRPQDLVELRKVLSSYDFVVGSRYVPGGQVINWGLLRKLISRGGSWYSRMILGYPIQDWTGGFNGWSASVIKALLETGIQSEGYAFQIELKYKALKMGFKGKEVPICFEDRRVGQSKMSSRIVLEALYRVWRIKS